VDRFLKHRRRGDSIVEFALVMPILLLILFGILEVGRVLDAWIVVKNAAREGARIGTLATTSTTAQTNAQQAATAYLQTAFASRTDVDQTFVQVPAVSATSDNVQVNVEADVHIYTPFMQAILSASLPVRATAIMPRML
jgi:Flp pilus assembly protein TadG